MAFRISESTIFHDAVRYMRNNRFALSELQNQISSGKRVNSVADDPADASRILRLRRGAEQLDQFQRNIGHAETRLDLTESALDATIGVLKRIRELAVQADSPDEPNFDKIAPEVEQLFAELFQIANTSSGGEHLFAGFATDNAAFTLSGSFVAGVADPLFPDAVYQGDGGLISVQIAEASTIESNIPGSHVFGGDFDGDGAVDAGRVDLFEVVRDLRNRLVDPAGFGAPAGVLDDVDVAIDQVVQSLGKLGANSNRLEIANLQIDELRLVFETERSALEDIDLIKASTDLARSEVVLQSSLAVSARVLQPTLLNFLS